LAAAIVNGSGAAEKGGGGGVCLVSGQWKIRFLRHLKILVNKSLALAERLLIQPVRDAILAPNP
jgi:hypothetical protein